MADQHNANVPAVGNLIANDIPDVKENLEFHKDALERIFETWSDTDNSAAKIDTATGFSDGTYNYEFPTNGIAAHSVIMLGNSSTKVWMYLNTAPPGWKATTDGADRVIAVAGGSDAYNANGGTNAGETWANLNSAFTHIHKYYNYVDQSNDGQRYNSSGVLTDLSLSTTNIDNGVSILHAQKNTTGSSFAFYALPDLYTNEKTSGLSDVRPVAALGKIFQLDTA